MSGVVEFATANQRSVKDLIELMQKSQKHIKNLVIMTVDEDAHTNIFYSPIEASVFAYLCKQLDAEFMEQFLFGGGEE